MRGNPHSGCAGKTQYNSPKEASRALRGIKKRKRATNTSRTDVYRCPYCSGWHIGANPGGSLKQKHRDLAFVKRKSAYFSESQPES